MNENEISHQIIGAALEVHKALGPGILESAYEATLSYELTLRGLFVRTQVPIPLIYKEVRQDVGFRIDMLVEHKVIVEIKSVEYLNPVVQAQVMTYLRLSGLKLGLLINFNSVLLKDGIQRVVNNL